MRVAIHDAVRTPRGKAFTGSLVDVTPLQLTATVLGALAERNHLDTARVDELTLGCSSVTGEQGADIARTAALTAGWDDGVAGGTVSRLCCSGIDAIASAAAKIEAGIHDVAVAGGVESMTRVGMFDDHGPLHADPEVAATAGFVSIGASADALANLAGLTRPELDAWALRSHRRAADATAAGRFARALVAVRDDTGRVVLDHDEAIRPDTTLEALAALPELFAEDLSGGVGDVLTTRLEGLGTVTPLHTVATAPRMTDAASAVLLAREGALDLPARARLVAAAEVAVRSPGLTGAAVAIERALASAGMSVGEVDLFEINESFCATPLHAIGALGIDPERVNVNGGAVAMGHPLGATGGILLATLLDELEARGLRTGALAIPAAAGLGSALVIERV